jgi:hypothetical protein
MEVDVVSLPEVLLVDDIGSSAFGHPGRMGGPDAKLARVTILVGEVQLDEPIPMNINVDAFDVDEGAEPCVVTRDKGRSVGLQVDVSTHVDNAKFGRRWGQ